MSKFNDISNKRFENLVAQYPVSQYQSNKNYLWLCKCDCGRTCVKPENHLQQQVAKRCPTCSYELRRCKR